MKKTLLFICVILLNAAFLPASGIAVVSSKSGRTTLVRANKNVKFATGGILENNDEIETGSKSGLSCKFIDGLASLHLFSGTMVKINSRAGQTGYNKEAEIAKGSLYIKHQSDEGSLAVFHGKSKMSSNGASFLVKSTGGEKVKITVFSGTVLLTGADGTSSEIGARKTAEVPSRGVAKIRPTKDSDLTPEELALIKPSPEQDQRSITVPMADAQGRVKYVELVW